MKALIKKILKSGKMGRVIYPCVQWAYLKYAIPHRRRRLRRHGVDAMRRLHDFLMSNNIDYYCDSGTLLGFVREHDFIKTDDDIDIAVVENSINPIDLLKLMLNHGYEYIHAFDYRGKILEFTVADRTGITVDVFWQTLKDGSSTILDAWGVYWKPEIDYPTETANSVISYPFLRPTGFVEMDVLGIKVRVPENVEAVLDTEYAGWRVPNPSFKHDQMCPHTDWPGFAFRLTKDEALCHE